MHNDGKKAILLVRVSTLKQDFDEQERELFDMAIADGYKESDIIAICEKESGIKLKEEERRGLNRMKEEISKGGVSCVYAWEPSRIGRKKKVIFSVTDFLVEREIQLIIKEPYMRLLNEDGSINDNTETSLTIHAQLAESEMRNKLARWRRTRIKKSRLGIWNGGSTIRYGYTIDDKKNFILDEKEAGVIRLIYELYTTTNMGQDSVRRELLRRGIEMTQNRIQRILKFEGYAGRTVHSPYYMNGEKKSGYELNYPAIISEEVFELAQKKKETANSLTHKGHNYYFGKGLLRCSACGHLYIAYKHSALYMCVAYKHDNKDIIKCHNNTSININVLDTLLWDATVSEYIKARAAATEDSRTEYQKQINLCQDIITAADGRIEKAQMSKKRYAIIFAKGHITEEEYEQAISQLDTEISEIRREVLSAEGKISQYEKMMNAFYEPNYVDILRNLAETAFSYNELRDMSEMVHTYISNVSLKQTDRFGKRTKEVKIVATDGSIYEYCARYECGGAHKHHFWKREQQPFEFVDEYREIIPKIVINRRLGRTCSKDISTPEVTIIKSNAEYYLTPVKPKEIKSDKSIGVAALVNMTDRLKT